MPRAPRLPRAARQSLVLLLALATAPQAMAQPNASPERTARAREHYARALELYDAGAHSRALLEFQSAYAIMGDARLLFNIGQLEFALGRHSHARRSLERYLREAGDHIAPARRADVLRQLAELEKLAGDAAEPKAPAAAQGDSHRHGPDVSRGQPPRQQRASAVPPRERRIPPHAAAAWISSGVLGLGAIGTAVATVLASRRYAELRSAPASADAASARAALDHQRELAQDLSLATDVLALAAIGSAGLGLYFTLSGDGDEPARLSVELTSTDVHLTGRF